jgi:AcrR family transcriptional regulator
MAGRKPEGDKRSQILRAAADVFSAREFHLVPVEDVATAAGVGKGTLYLYFPTKEQLFYATIIEALDVLLAELETATRGLRGEEALRTFAHRLADFFWRRPHLSVLVQRYEHKQREPEGEAWRDRRTRLVALVRTLLAPEARTAGLDAAQATVAAEMLLAMIRGALLSQQDRADPAPLASFVVRVFLHGLRQADVAARPRRERPRRAAAGARR